MASRDAISRFRLLVPRDFRGSLGQLGAVEGICLSGADAAEMILCDRLKNSTTDTERDVDVTISFENAEGKRTAFIGN